MLSAPPPGETVAPSGPVRYRPAADPALRELVSVVWRTEVGPESQTVRVLPDAAVDLVITADRIAVAGPDTGPSVERLPAGPVVGLQVRPEAVPALLGVPASALLDARTEIADLWGAPGEWLTDRARGAATLRARVAVVEEALAARARRTTLLPHVAGLRELVASVGRLDLVDLGVGERQLRRRCVAAFGYGPKVLARVMRFQRALDHLRSAVSGSLAEVALRAGYVDQSHLARDVGEFSGLTPAGLRDALSASRVAGPSAA